MSMIISKTGKAHGRGSMPYKWVSGLTAEEREAVRNGETVLVVDQMHRGTKLTTPYKQVTWDPRRPGKYGHQCYWHDVPEGA